MNDGDKNEDILLSTFDRGRTILFNKSFDETSNTIFYKNVFGLLIYIVIFVVIIPHSLLKKNMYLITTLYFSNLDMIATVLGFSGGPYNIWQYLYNPEVTTKLGFMSSTLINYLALIGVGFVVLNYATKHKNMFRGLAMLFIILPITYLLPGNLIVYGMNYVATHLFSRNLDYYTRWIITSLIGFIMIIGIIVFERIITTILSPYLEKVLIHIYKIYK